MNSKAIVTLADSNYFDLLVELINSIKKNDINKDISICVLDAGMTESQLKMIKVSMVNPLAPESDQHPVSPDNNTAALFI